MSPFQRAIRDMKTDPEMQTIDVAAQDRDIAFQLLGEGRDDLIALARSMTSGPEDTIQPNQAMIEGACRDGITLLGIMDGRPVSQISISIRPDGAHAAEAWPSDCGIWIDTIFVDARHRGQGIGRDTAIAGAEAMGRLLEISMQLDPHAWEYLDPDPGAEETDASRSLVRRIGDSLAQYFEQISSNERTPECL